MKYGPVLTPHNPADFDIVAENLNQFMDAITLPEPCKVLLNAPIDMTDLFMVQIRNKFIASNFKKITVRKLYKHPDFLTQSGNCLVFHAFENVQLDGLKMVGCQGEILDQNFAIGQLGFIKAGGNLEPATNFKVTNCNIGKMDSWMFLLANADQAEISHNTFYSTRRNGTGYAGVWQRSPSGTSGHHCYVRWNRFFNTRHCIDGSGQANIYHFENNLIYGNSSNSPVARHNNDSHQGGAGDVIRNNWFCDRSRPFSLQEVVTI